MLILIKGRFFLGIVLFFYVGSLSTLYSVDYQPDISIIRGGWHTEGVWVGDDRYYSIHPVEERTVVHNFLSPGSYRMDIKIENDGIKRDDYEITASGQNEGWDVDFTFMSYADGLCPAPPPLVTNALTGDGLEVYDIDFTKYIMLCLEVELMPQEDRPIINPCEIIINATSLRSPLEQKDEAKIILRYIPIYPFYADVQLPDSLWRCLILIPNGYEDLWNRWPLPRFNLSNPGSVSIEIYRVGFFVRNRLLKTYNFTTNQIGTYSLIWDGRDSSEKQATKGRIKYIVKTAESKKVRRFCMKRKYWE